MLRVSRHVQVRNLASCIKAAIDFVSPESFEHVLGLTQERRMLTMQEIQINPNKHITNRTHADKLQVPPASALCRSTASSHAVLLSHI